MSEATEHQSVQICPQCGAPMREMDHCSQRGCRTATPAPSAGFARMGMRCGFPCRMINRIATTDLHY